MFISELGQSLAGQFKALSDPQRLRIVALCRVGELSVGELAAVLGQSQPRVSQHLKQLCQAGLLEGFRDGKRVYYRLPRARTPAQRRLLAVLPDADPGFDADARRLRDLRGVKVAEPGPEDPTQRAVAHALIELTVAAPLGDLLDIGCGRGRLLKLLASRSNRAVGVDVDAESRSIARAELFLAGFGNCTLRQGDMYRLEFDDASFDTIILDDVLGGADAPELVLEEAKRLLRPTGRLVVLHRLGDADAAYAGREIAAWSAACGLRMAPPRSLPARNPQWLLSVLTTSGVDVAAA